MSRQADYVFADAETDRERLRLHAMQDEFDPDTFRRLDHLEVGPGWTCLEIGCGAGSVLQWLANRVGPRGRVVGLDLDLRLTAHIEAANVQLRKGDVTTIDLGDGVFDLIHARFVFIHINQRDRALASMVRALKPGGVLFLEEPDFGPAGSAAGDGEGDGVVARTYEAMRQMYLAAGGDPFLGRRLIGWMQNHGLRVVGAEAAASVWQGGSRRAQLRQQAIEHLCPRLLDTGAATARDLERFLQLATDPTTWGFDFTTVAAWARKA